MRYITSLALLLITLHANAQSAAPNWLEESLYGNGKINTVVIVVAIILLGIGLWMFRMDRKLSRLEKKIKP